MVNQIAPLSPEGINSYIDKFFELDISKKETLKNFLELRPSWQQLMVTPFNLELLCNIWLDQGMKPSLQTLTDLYKQVFDLILKNAYVKEHSLPLGENLRVEMIEGHYKYAIRQMERLAYNSMKKKKLCEELSDDISVSVNEEDMTAIKKI